MEQRWRAAREACDAGTCDPDEKKFHRAGCERKQIAVERFVSTADATLQGEWVRGEPGEGVIDLSKAAGVALPHDPALYSDFLPPAPFDTEKAGQSGGWCAPTSCEAGVCLSGDEHDPNCETPGAAYKVPDDIWSSPVLEFPAVKVQRGGLRFPLVTLDWIIRPVRGHWWSRRWYELLVRPRGSATEPISFGFYRKEQEANDLVADLNKLNLEINRRRDQIDDASR